MARYQYVDYDNNLVSTDDQSQAASYDNMGYRKAGEEDIKVQNIKDHYTGWKNAAGSAVLGAASQIPFAGPAISKIAGMGLPGGQYQAQDMMNNLKTAQPVAYATGQVAGGTAAFASGEGMIGAASEAAGLEGASYLAQAAKGSLTNVLLGESHKVDQSIMAHATSDAGLEHVWADVGMDTLMDAAVGAATPLPGLAIGKAARALGAAGDALSNAGSKEAVLNYAKTASAFEKAQADEVAQTFQAKGYADMTPSQVRADIQARLPDLEAQFNEIKANSSAKMPPNAVGKFADNLGDILEGHPDANSIIGRVAKADQLGLEDLHNLRRDIDAKIPYKTLEPSVGDRQLYEARKEVDRAMNTVLDTDDLMTGGARAQTWKQINRDYSHMSIIDSAVGLRSSPALDAAVSLGRKVVNKDTKAAYGLSAWLFGWKGLGGYKLLDAGLSAAERFQSGEYAEAAKTLGNVFNKQADKWSRAVAAGLYGVPEAVAAGLDTWSHEHYEHKAARATWVASNPQQASSNLGSHLVDAHGADSDTAMRLTQRAVGIQNTLTGQKPPNPAVGQMIPSQSSVPPEMKEEWLGLHAVAHDPTYALTHPSPKNMAMLKQYYPQFYQNTVTAIIAQLQNNPDLPLEGRQWAAAVVGQPVDTMTDPAMWELLQMGRQAYAQQQQMAQQQAQKGSKAGGMQASGNSGNSTVDSNSTELQQLQGKA